MARRSVPEINAGSMADIAFLLLVFFLVTTTMETNKGLSRKLPEWNPDNIDQNIDLNKRNVFTVLINSNNDLLVKGELGKLDQLCDKVKEFIVNKHHLENLSERAKPRDVAYFGNVDYISKGVVSLQNDRGTKYEKYIQVQNELVRAFNELRNKKAKSKFGKTYDELGKLKDEESKKKISAIREIYPLAISEAEPRAIGK